MTGKELYELYRTVLDSQDCRCDSFETLEEDDQETWELLAAKLQERDDASEAAIARLSEDVKILGKEVGAQSDTILKLRALLTKAEILIGTQDHTLQDNIRTIAQLQNKLK